MLVLGIVVLAAGAGCFFYSAPKMDFIRSGWGQLAIGLGGDQANRELQLYQTMYYGGIVLMILGSAFLIAGLVTLGRKRQEP